MRCSSLFCLVSRRTVNRTARFVVVYIEAGYFSLPSCITIVDGVRLRMVMRCVNILCLRFLLDVFVREMMMNVGSSLSEKIWR